MNKKKNDSDAALNLGHIDRFLEEEGVALPEGETSTAATVPDRPEPAAPEVSSKPPHSAEPGDGAGDPSAVEEDAQEPSPESESEAPPRERVEVPIEVSEDGMEAVAKVIDPRAIEEDIQAALQDAGVVHGIDEKAIRSAVRTAADTGKALRDVVVANGSPPTPPAAPRLNHLLPEGLEKLPNLGPVAKLLSLETAREIAAAAAEMRGWLVAPGEKLAEVVPDAGEAGTSVLGVDVDPPPREETASSGASNPGVGASGGVDSGEIRSEVLGYAGMLEGRISVLAPVWVARDGMAAYFLHLARLPGSIKPTVEQLDQALAGHEIVHGIHTETLPKLCAAIARGKVPRPLIRVARGTRVTEPQDAAARFTFEHEEQAGSVRPDGSIDFRERNAFPAVEENELLVESAPPRAGVPGTTVIGETVEPRPPNLVELVAGENVRAESEGDVQKVYAAIAGGASAKTVEVRSGEALTRQITLHVRATAQINGDVDYASGNVDHKGNVEIKGNILGGFSVRATGDVTVSGGIEDGAKVTCDGSLMVRQGIFGERTVIKVGGSVKTKFLQNATVTAGGDITAGSYVHGSDVSAGGRVVVEGAGGAGGGIVGGETWAVGGVVTKNCGSERSASTFIAVGVDRAAYALWRKSAATAEKAATLLRNLMRSIGLKSLDAGAVKALLARSAARKNEFLHYVKKANELAKIREENAAQADTLLRRIESSGDSASLAVSDVAYDRVTLRIGTYETRLDEARKAVRYVLRREKKKDGIIWVPLAEEQQEEPEENGSGAGDAEKDAPSGT